MCIFTVLCGGMGGWGHVHLHVVCMDVEAREPLQYPAQTDCLHLCHRVYHWPETDQLS